MTFTYSSTSIVFKGSLYPFTASYKRFQTAGVSADGQTVAVRDEAIEEVYWKIILHEPHSKISDIRSFLLNTVGIQKYYFTFTPDSGMDLGGGAGVAQYARLWSANFIDTMHAWHQYRFEMILRKELV